MLKTGLKACIESFIVLLTYAHTKVMFSTKIYRTIVSLEFSFLFVLRHLFTFFFFFFAVDF